MTAAARLFADLELLSAVASRFCLAARAEVDPPSPLDRAPLLRPAHAPSPRTSRSIERERPAPVASPQVWRDVPERGVSAGPTRCVYCGARLHTGAGCTGDALDYDEREAVSL